MSKKSKTKVVFSKAKEMVEDLFPNDTAKQHETLQIWISAGKVGNPDNVKSRSWSIPGTDLTFHPSSPYPASSKKHEANNKETTEIKLIRKLMTMGFQDVYDVIKGLQEEGVLSTIDESLYVDRYKDRISKAGKQGILRFLNIED